MDVETNNHYKRPMIEVVDLYGDDMMKDFVPFSETEVIDGPIVDTDPDDGMSPGAALSKEYSAWDE